MRIVTAGHVQQLVPQPTTEHVIRTKKKPRIVEPVNKTEKTGLKKNKKIDITVT